MKKLNDFIDKAPLWQVWIFGWFLTAILMFLMFWGFDAGFSVVDGTKVHPILVYVKIGAAGGVLFGLMVMLMVSMMRSSQKFWDRAKEVEAEINQASTKEALQKVFDEDFQQLRTLSTGLPHHSELTRLHTIMKTKYQYVK